ncbi:MAG: TetR/AcrR family transcriptional regulator [Bdellovibrionales bacterium]
MPRAKARDLSIVHVPLDLRKGARTRLKVIDSAYRCIARDGYYRTTFQTIADHAKVSQPLVVKIFVSRENIFPMVAAHLLQQAILRTEARLQAGQAITVAQKLETYYEVSLDMLEADPDLPNFYINLYYLSTYDPKTREINQAIRKGALDRIEGFLMGSPKVQRRRDLSLRRIATGLHDLLTGSILNCVALGSDWDKPALLKNLRVSFLDGLDL